MGFGPVKFVSAQFSNFKPHQLDRLLSEITRNTNIFESAQLNYILHEGTICIHEELQAHLFEYLSACGNYWNIYYLRGLEDTAHKCSFC